MTIESSQIIIFYVLGLVMFILSIEEEKILTKFIYLGVAFLVNTMGYYLSYSESAYTGTSYLPLMLVILSILWMLYMSFMLIRTEFNDDYKQDRE